MSRLALGLGIILVLVLLPIACSQQGYPAIRLVLYTDKIYTVDAYFTDKQPGVYVLRDGLSNCKTIAYVRIGSDYFKYCRDTTTSAEIEIVVDPPKIIRNIRVYNANMQPEPEIYTLMVFSGSEYNLARIRLRACYDPINNRWVSYTWEFRCLNCYTRQIVPRFVLARGDYGTIPTTFSVVHGYETPTGPVFGNWIHGSMCTVHEFWAGCSDSYTLYSATADDFRSNRAWKWVIGKNGPSPLGYVYVDFSSIPSTPTITPPSSQPASTHSSTLLLLAGIGVALLGLLLVRKP